MRKNTLVLIAVLMAGNVVRAVQNPSSNPTNLGSDANGNPLRKALKTGHISNYDESKVGPYTLPDPLMLSNGQRVRSARVWMNQRRKELIQFYENEIYGHVPANAPKVTWEVGPADRSWRNGTAVRKQVIANVGEGVNRRRFSVWLYTPAKASRPAPLLLSIIFAPVARGGDLAPSGEPPVADE